MYRKIFVIAVALVLSLTDVGFTAVIFDQPPTAGPVHIWQITSFRNADDFSLAAPFQLDGMEFWAVGNPDFLSSFSGTMSWGIYDDASGLPGSLLFSGSSSAVSAIDTGIGNFMGNRFDVSFDLTSPVMLNGATRYWLELHEGSTLTSNDGSEILWVTGVANPASQYLFAERRLSETNWYPMVEDLAFRLVGQRQPVPEPATMLLLGFGLMGLAGVRRLKK